MDRDLLATSSSPDILPAASRGSFMSCLSYSLQRSRFPLKLLVTLSLLGYLISRIDFKRVPETFSSIHWLPLTVAVAFSHIDRILMAIKWRLLIKTQGLSVSVFEAITTTYMGNFGGQFLPGGVGTDVVRVYLLRKLHLPIISVA